MSTYAQCLFISTKRAEQFLIELTPSGTVKPGVVAELSGVFGEIGLPAFLLALLEQLKGKASDPTQDELLQMHLMIHVKAFNENMIPALEGDAAQALAYLTVATRPEHGH